MLAILLCIILIIVIIIVINLDKQEFSWMVSDIFNSSSSTVSATSFVGGRFWLYLMRIMTCI